MQKSANQGCGNFSQFRKFPSQIYQKVIYKKNKTSLCLVWWYIVYFVQPNIYCLLFVFFFLRYLYLCYMICGHFWKLRDRVAEANKLLACMFKIEVNFVPRIFIMIVKRPRSNNGNWYTFREVFWTKFFRARPLQQASLPWYFSIW